MRYFFSFQKCFDFFFNISEKTGYFNTGFVFYNVNIQPDIIQNWLKNNGENHKFFSKDFWNCFENFRFF